MPKIIKGGTAEVPTYTEEATTLVDGFVTALTAPLSVLKKGEDETEFYSSRDVGIAALSWAAVGIFAGDRFGNSIPYLGGRR